MAITVFVQNTVPHLFSPSEDELIKFSQLALQDYPEESSITLRLVSCDEIQELNSTYRHKDKPTNVLSFPYEQDVHDSHPVLGDIIICNEVVNQEADEQKKTQIAHWAHMVIHGCLHCLGYDHIDDAEAEVMESMEVELLKTLGYDNPYI